MRAHCRSRKLRFTTSYHTQFPQYLRKRLPVPVSWSYGVLGAVATPADFMQNLGAFTVYGSVIVVLWIAATLPVLIGLVIVLPIIFGSIYASYVDIFERTAEQAA